MSWQVALDGPEMVLRELADVFAANDEVRLKRADYGWVLEGSRFEPLPDAEAVRNDALEIVAALSGTARILLGSQATLAVGSVTNVRPNGGRDIFVQAEPARFTITGSPASLRVVRADGNVEEHRRGGPSPAWLGRALADPEVARALRLCNADSLSWTDLYRLFEIVCTAVGGERAVSQLGWATRSELRRFSHSANSVAAGGDEARHGVESTQPPPDPMPLSDARVLIDRLLTRWIEHRAA